MVKHGFVSRILLGTLVLGMASAAGCDQSADPHSLVIWHAWSGSEQAALKGIIRRYEASHPGYTVTALPVPFNQLRNKFLTAAAANGGPELHAAQVLRPLDGWLTAQRRQRFLPTALRALQIGSDTYAVPESVESVGLFYNKKLLPQAPQHMEALLRIPVPAGVNRLAIRSNFFFTAPWFLGYGGRLFDGQGQLAMDGKAGAEYLGWMRRLLDAPGVGGKDDYSYMDSLFREGKVAAIINGPWALADYQKVFGSDLGVALLPALPGGIPARPFVGLKCVMANDNTPQSHRPVVDGFLETLTAPESALELSAAGHIPVQPALAGKLPEGQRVFLEQAARGEPLPNFAAMGMVWEPMDKAIAAVTTQDADPATTMQETVAIISARTAKGHGQ
jgi:arabinogalactan oligomer/maltooligosaccharide transport system substrate-binding protein